MKKLLIIIILAVSALTSRAQSTALDVADKYFANKEYSKASDYYDQVLKADPANVKALRRMGFCIMNFQGQELNATQFFNRALKIEPKDPVSNYYMGVIFMDQAKLASNTNEKSDYKAKAALYLKNAVNYGSEDAKGAIKDLNGI